jgi:small subunit ribosomal protein S10
MDTFLEYIQRNLPEGTAMKATKIELQKIPEHLKQ